MSLYISSLNSGSNGNCYYVGNDNEAILIDVGISCKEVEKRMHRLSLDIQKVKAIFISHEHSDHIRGVVVLARKYNLPVYITPSTLKYSVLNLNEELTKTFNAHEPIIIGALSVIAFPKFHDAYDPYSFIIESNGVKVGVLTDIGSVCEHVIHYFKQCHAAFLEANYDEEMLSLGRYPFYLKKRISGGKGHLSNNQALELFLKHKLPHMSHLILSHLSKENNTVELVEELFNKHAQKTTIIVASRYTETPVFTIKTTHAIESIKKPISPLKKTVVPQQLQMSLFQ